MFFINNLFENELLKCSDNVLINEPMKKHTSFKIGGCADYFISASSTDEIISIINLCKKYKVPFHMIGNGSNLLVSDKGVRGVIIQIGEKLNSFNISGTKINAECGILLSRIANEAQKASLSGLEFASGIPGTLGGGIYMNAGAYDGELKNVVDSVTYIDNDGNINIASSDKLDFRYRHSMFSDSPYIIISATLTLKKGNKDEIKAKMIDFNSRRISKQPLNMPSAGSTFKRPEGHFAGKLIQDAGLSGYSIGGAQVSEKHSGFVVNTGSATAKDVMDLILHIQNTVKNKFNVLLEPELKTLGDF